MSKPVTHLEYAISCGEGTLLEYGVWDLESDFTPTNPENLPENFTVIMSPCSADCQTGA